MHVVPLSPLLTPELVARVLCVRPGFTWLDGGMERGSEGRFSFLGVDPVATHRVRWDERRHPFAGLDELVPARDTEPEAAAQAGLSSIIEAFPRWIGFIAYDSAWAGSARARHPRGSLPLVCFQRYDALVVFDHERGRAFLLGDDEVACERLTRALEAPPTTALSFSVSELLHPPAAPHLSAISEALELIRDGDVYLLNLARRFEARLSGSPFALALRMRALSPVPLGFYFDGGDHQVIGRSMERFIRLRRSDHTLWTSPIKGTVAGEDVATADRLLRADPKELAEHAMLIDLMRNDLGRVAIYGSVRVADCMSVQPFAGLSHLVSTITARVPPSITLAETLTATFPPGSVTGTPKERAIQRIEELESHARGLYTGAYGFVDRAGGLSLAVAIRSAVVQDGRVEYWAGGGIVADSDPQRELAETELKARVFLDACG